jgi:hypothetical protein
MRSGEAATPPRPCWGRDPGSGEDVTLPEAEAKAKPWGWVRRRFPPEAEPWGRARRSFLLHLRLNSTVVGFTWVVGTAAGAGRAALFPCQIGQ